MRSDRHSKPPSTTCHFISEQTMRQLDYVINQCKGAIYAGTPIIFLESDDIGLIDDIINNGRVFPFWYNHPGEGWKPSPSDGCMGQLPDNIVVMDHDLRRGFEDFRNGLIFNNNRKSTYRTPDSNTCYITSSGAERVNFLMAVRNFTFANIPGHDNKAEELLNQHVAYYLSAPRHDWIRRCTIMLQSPDIYVPRGLENFVEVITVPPLGDDEIREIIEEEAKKRGDKPYESLMKVLVVNLRGFNPRSIRDILGRIDLECNGIFNPETERIGIRIIKDMKSQKLKKEGLLKLKNVDPKRNVSGLGNISRWLNERVELFKDPLLARERWHIAPPKGILVSGIPGTGKSALANKIASIFDIPLLQFDMGSVLGKYTGESEGNMRRVLRLAESMSPCVLWIDEIEKAFSSASSSGDADGGQGKRLFGLFLTWMQEKTFPCFIFATANNISALPPEFLRRGRFDRKFYTFMPTKNDCIEIFRSIIRSNNTKETEHFPKETYSDAFLSQILDFCGSRGKFMTGADIEGIIEDAKFSYYNRHWRNNPSADGIYRADLFRRELEDAIMDVQTYGETDMEKIVTCLLDLSKNMFAPASSSDIIDIRKVDPRKITIPQYAGQPNGYDEYLYQHIQKQIDFLHKKAYPND